MEESLKKILLVEDDPNFGTVLKEYLSLNGYEVVHAKNGMEGFEKFKKTDYHLCILDVMMPYKDGFTLAKEIREKNTEIPIIFLTAKALKEDVLKGYKVGGDDYLNKPFDSEVLLMKIKAIIQRKTVDTLADSKQFEFTIGEFAFNSKLRFLTHKSEKPAKLSPKENELLRLLILHENDLMPREIALTIARSSRKMLMCRHLRLPLMRCDHLSEGCWECCCLVQCALSTEFAVLSVV